MGSTSGEAPHTGVLRGDGRAQEDALAPSGDGDGVRPAPGTCSRNITEIGGYINLLRKDERMLSLLLASILGLPRTSREQ